MTIIITDADVERLMTMPDCIEALETVLTKAMWDLRRPGVDPIKVAAMIERSFVRR